jgi:hypothetical protein
MYTALKLFRISVGLGFVINLNFALPALFAPVAGGENPRLSGALAGLIAEYSG